MDMCLLAIGRGGVSNLIKFYITLKLPNKEEYEVGPRYYGLVDANIHTEFCISVLYIRYWLKQYHVYI